jgi:hypothetical protein
VRKRILPFIISPEKNMKDISKISDVVIGLDEGMIDLSFK